MKKWSWVIVLSLFLTGCGTQFAYNNLDWLIHWYVDDFIDLNRTQTQVFDEDFKQWHQWHRSEELPKYHAHLQIIKAQIQDKSLTEVELEQHFLDVRGYWEALRDRVSPDLTAMATTLSEKQIEALFEQLQEDNDEQQEEHDEFYAMSEDERSKDRFKRLEKELKEWIGKLTPEQKSIVKRYQPEFKRNWQNWIDFHQTMRDAAKTLFDERAANPNFEAQLQHLMTHPEAYRSEEMIANSDFNRALYSQLTAEVLLILTPKQTRRLIAKIEDYIEDFEVLIANE